MAAPNRFLQAGIAAAAMLAAACTDWPKPIIIAQTPRETVALRVEPALGKSHDHPAAISPEVIARVLQGLHVTERGRLGLDIVLGRDDAKAAFTNPEIAALAPSLAEGLRKASARDVAEFYVVANDARSGPLITSGGMFVRGGQLIVILANVRTAPSAGPYEGTAYELDNRDAPLQPLTRHRFVVSFAPPDARVPAPDLGYPDLARVVALDLEKLRALSR